MTDNDNFTKYHSYSHNFKYLFNLVEISIYSFFFIIHGDNKNKSRFTNIYT